MRASELERAEERSRLLQQNLLQGVLSCFFLQAALCTSVLFGNGAKAAIPVTRGLLGAAAFFAIRVPLGLLRVRKLDKYNERYGVKR